jgi:hypothetical protein
MITPPDNHQPQSPIAQICGKDGGVKLAMVVSQVQSGHSKVHVLALRMATPAGGFNWWMQHSFRLSGR